MTVTLAYANPSSNPPIAARRSAGLLTHWVHWAASYSTRYQAHRQQAAAQRSAAQSQGDAARVRLMADRVRDSHPGFAADLYAAADRAMVASGS